MTVRYRFAPWIGAAMALFAVSLTAMSSAAHAQTQPQAQSRQTPTVNARFTAWLRAMDAQVAVGTALNDEFTELLNRLSDPRAETRPEIVRASRDLAARGNRDLTVALNTLRTVGPFTDPLASGDVLRTATLLYNSNTTYLERMNETMLVMVEFANALEANDNAELRRLAPRLMRSLSSLLDGQRLQLLSAQAQLSPTSSRYHSLGGVGVLYEGLSATSFPGVDNSAATLRRLAGEARTWAASGRTALANERRGLAQFPVRARPAFTQAYDLEAQAQDLIDELAAIFDEAAAAADRTDNFGVLNRQFAPRIAEIETALMEISQRQQQLVTPFMK